MWRWRIFWRRQSVAARWLARAVVSSACLRWVRSYGHRSGDQP